MVRALAIAGREEQASVQDVEVPAPGPGQVRVTVEAASINGIDGTAAAGYLWDMLPHSFPVVLGRDAAGTVDAVGDGVTAVTIGDRVTGVITAMELGAGTIAEAAILDAGSVTTVPEGVSSTQAAAVGLAAVTAVDLVDALTLTGDDTVLVSGATGGVGSFAVQLAAATGATVLATSRPGTGETFVRDLGATGVVDHTGDIAAAVKGAAPEGITAVVHAAGDAGMLAGLLHPGGRLASALGADGEQLGRDDITVTPVMGAATPEKLRALLDQVAAGTLQVPTHGTYPLDQATTALAAFGGHKLGKLIVTTS